MAETLPTVEELEQLYHEKGKEAVVWYAWRNALRALPLLGYLPLNKIWEEQTVKHIYNICRVHLFLTVNFAGQKKSDIVADVVVAGSAAVVDSTYDAAYTATYTATYTAAYIATYIAEATYAKIANITSITDIANIIAIADDAYAYAYTYVADDDARGRL